MNTDILKNERNIILVVDSIMSVSITCLTIVMYILLVIETAE